MPSPPEETEVSDAHVSAIGRLVLAVSKIDILLTDLAAAIMRTDILSAIAAIHHQQISSKIDTLKTLVRLNAGHGRGTNILKLLDEAESVVDYRNTLVHAHWSVDRDGEIYVVRFRARGEFKRSRVPVEASQILQKAQEGDKIADRLGEFRDRIWQSSAQPHDNPGTQTPPQP